MPEPIERPAFAEWLWKRGITYKDRNLQQALGVSYETIRCICLPFGDPKRQRPSEDVLRRIVEYTGREITAADFYPPDLRGGDPELLRQVRAL